MKQIIRYLQNINFHRTHVFKNIHPVFILFLISVIIRLVMLLNSDDVDISNAYISIEPTRSLLDRNIVGFHAPPLEIYLIKIMHFFSQSAMATRMPNFILGSLSVVPFYYLVNILYNRKIAFFSSIALSIFPEYIKMNASTKEYIPFYFFIFTTLYFFYKFKQDKNKRISSLLFSAIALNLASMSRYEAWIFIPLLSILSLQYKKKYFLIFSFTAMIFPIIWMYFNYKFFGNPIEFYLSQVRNVKEEIIFGIGPNTNFNFLDGFLKLFSMLELIFKPVIFYLGLFGLIRSIFDGKYIFPFIFLIISSVMTIKLINHSLFLHIDYVLFLALFFLVFIIYGAINIPTPFLKKAFFYFFILYLSISWIKVTIKERPLLPANQIDILTYFKNNLQQNERIAVLGNTAPLLSVYLEFPSMAERITSIKIHSIKYMNRGMHEIDNVWLSEWTKNNSPDYIVIDATNYPILLIPNIKEIIKFFPTARAQCVFNKEKINIYKINYHRN